jgi:hypothetical protein
MSTDLRLRLAYMVVSAGIAVAAAILAAHGAVSPLNDPIGMGPPI